ncbi:MAG: GerMN domain-containing protein [Desulfobacterales bacterium]
MITSMAAYIKIDPARVVRMFFLTALIVFGVCAVGVCQTAGPPLEGGVEQILPEPEDADYPVYLYFVDKGNAYLVSEARKIRNNTDPQAYCRRIVQALINGPGAELARTIPSDTRLRAVYITSDHTAYVDLSAAAANSHSGGVRTELMTVYSIVNTLILNVSAVDRVKLLIDGQEADTLAGHIDIRFPLNADMLLVR